MVPGLPELKGCLDNALRHREFVGVSVQGREWDSMILEAPFQFRIFFDSMNLLLFTF